MHASKPPTEHDVGFQGCDNVTICRKSHKYSKSPSEIFCRRLFSEYSEVDN